VKKQTLLIFMTVLFLSACSVGPDYEKPSLSFSDQWFSVTEQKTSSSEEIKTDWWRIFGDPQLEKYIETAVVQNKELEAARAGVLRARALRREAIAPFYPFMDAELTRTRQGTSGATSETFSAGSRRTIYDGSLNASWEIDLFGGTRRTEEAEQARLQGTLDERRGVLLAVLAETARNYYDVRGLQKRIAITQKNIDVQEQTYQLVENLAVVGEASEFDLSRARGQLQLNQSRLPDLDADMKAGIYRLSVLLGQPPEALLKEMQTTKLLPAPPDVVPVGLRSDILRRRPDVRAAEQQLAAAVAEIGVATAELFPQFFLTGSAGRSASVFSDLFDPISNTFSFGQLLRWPIFEGGAIRARIKVREAEAQQAVALYEQAVLDSLADAESALIRYAHKLETRNRLQSAVESRQHAVRLSGALFNAGEENFLAVLDAERELIIAEDQLVVSETDTLLNLVSLYTALGGGWEVFEDQP
jgi:multidrug efflux system outer membrane protein